MAILIKDNHDEFINDIIYLSMRTSAVFSLSQVFKMNAKKHIFMLTAWTVRFFNLSSASRS